MIGARITFLTLACFALALVSRVALIDHPPIYDELYQILPAISWNENGTFNVLDGLYTRAAMFSKLIATSFDLHGDFSVTAARFVPSAIPGAALVALMFGWTYRTCGAVAGFITAGFMILWPNGIEVSQYVRFYALHGLLFVSSALLIYTALTRDLTLWLRGLMWAVALALMLATFKLQILTVLGVVAIAVWVALAFGPKWLREHPKLWWVVGAVALGVVAVLFSGAMNETLTWAWITYNWEPWPRQDDTTFYHRDFRDNYATFWPLFPVAALIALRANPLPASFCIALFSITFVLQSFGGLKNIRYLYATMPFFFVIWGIALQALLPVLWRFLRETASAILPEPVRQIGSLVCAIFVVLFLLGGNASVIRSAKLIAGLDQNRLLGKTRWQWSEAKQMMQPWIDKGALIVTSEEMRAVQNVGDFDLAYNKPRFSEMLYSIGPDIQPFYKDFRTGRPIVGELSDMKNVISCEPIGVLIMDAPGLQSSSTVPLIEHANAMSLTVVQDQQTGMSLFGWEHQQATTAACAYDFGTDRAADRIRDGRATPQFISSAAADR